MWPWEHLAVGYLVYTLVLRLRGRRPPSDPELALLVVWTQVPDLIDKPLAWRYEVLPAGLSLAHSLLCAVPVTAAAVLGARHWGRPRAGLAVAVGYGTHLLGDVWYPWVLGSSPRVGFLLWPVVPVEPTQPGLGLVGHLELFAGRFGELLETGQGLSVLGLELALLGGAGWLWLRDGMPGVRALRRITAGLR